MDATTSTIAMSTIATEIERSSSPTPSEGSIYYDIDDGVTISQKSASQSPQPSISKDAEQKYLSPQIPPPSTPPTRPTCSLRTLDSIEISPSSSYERSPGSIASEDDEPESPFTTRSRSRSTSFESNSARKPSFSEEGVTASPSTTEEKKHPCLQCHLLNLKCSFTSLKERPAERYRPQFKYLTCTRCARNSEPFCIQQIPVEIYQDTKLDSKKQENVYTYDAEGVEKRVVTERVEGMLEERRVKKRFELPKMTMWKRQMLRPVFAPEGSWVVGDGS